MNTTWMRDHLTEYLSLLDRYADLTVRTTLGRSLFSSSDTPNSDERQDLAADLRQLEPTVKEILKRLDPKLAEFNFDVVNGKFDARNATQRGLGILDRMDEWAINLTPDAPSLPADRFHPWVWEAARTFWDSKHYRAAVEAAANSINAHTQDKVGRRDIADNDLMNQVLKESNRPGQKYLSLPGDPSDQTAQSRNRALRPFAEGCFAGIRNPATHEHGPDWEEQMALEQLAALSVLARWIDECDVKEVP